MKIFQRKSRLVSFRVSEKEYESLRRTAAVHGVRGISDIARFAVRKVLAVPMQEQDQWGTDDIYIEESVAKLAQNLEHLTDRMDQIVNRLDLLKSPGDDQRVNADVGARAASASGLLK